MVFLCKHSGLHVQPCDDVVAPPVEDESAMTQAPASPKLYVVGVSMTKFKKPGSGDGYLKLGREAATGALSDAGLGYGALKAAVCSYCYGAPTCGQAVLNGLDASRTGIPIFNTNNNCSSASTALYLSKLIAPQFGAVMVLGFEEMDRGLSEPFSEKTSPTSQQFERMFELGAAKGKLKPYLNNFTSDIIKVFAHAAREYKDAFGVGSAEDWARVALKNRIQGGGNSRASLHGRSTSLEKVLAPATLLLDPITSQMSAPTADGAAACIIVTEAVLATLPARTQARAVELCGQSMVSDLPSSFTKQADIARPFWALAGGHMAQVAARNALAEAGVTVEECGIVEVHDCFSPNEVFMYEALGMCAEGKGIELFNAGKWVQNSRGCKHFRLDDKWVVNASGGLVTKGHPIGATGLGQTFEIVSQLRGEAPDDRQIEPRPLCGLQHNFGFNGGAVVTVYRRYTTFRGADSIPPSLSQQELGQLRPYRAGWTNFQEQNIDLRFRTGVNVEGTVPAGLRGTFLRNGPGIINVHGTEIAHPIDGDGLVARLSFPGDGTAHLATSFVQTFSHVEERDAKRIIYPGQMGTRVPGKFRKFRDPAHTNVFYWGGKLLACHEYCGPHTLDPATLQPCDKGALGDALGQGPLAAHFRVDPVANSLIVFGFRPVNLMADAPPQISMYEFGPQWELRRKHELSVDGLNYVHDMVVTAHYYIVQITPFVKVDMEGVERVISGEQMPGEQVRIHPDLPCRLVVVSRATGKVVTVRDMAEKVHIYHFGNAWEEAGAAGGDPTAVHLEAACFPAKFTMRWQEKLWLTNANDAPAMYFRMVLDLAAPAKAVSMALCEAASCEFPTIHPDLHCLPPLPRDSPAAPRFAYLMANGDGKAVPYNAVVRYDARMEARQVYAPAGYTVGEPVFAPASATASAGQRAAQDDGWVVVQCFSPKAGTEFHVLDAKNIAAGPVCRLKLGCVLPNGFHGTWTREVFFRQSEGKSKL